MPSLTVVQLLPALESGGVERGTLEMANALVQRGHRSIVISSGGRMVTALEAGGSEHITWPIGEKSLLTLRLVLRLRRLLKREGVDILHVRSRLPAWIAWLAWRGMNPAVRPHLVTTVHGQYSVSRYSAVMMRGERIIAVSNTIKDYILKNYPDIDESRIHVIYRGIDEREFPHGYKAGNQWLRNWYAQYPQLLDNAVITLPGRLTRLKGHTDFIELMARLTASGIPVYGLIVGQVDPRHSGYAEELIQQVRQRGLNNIIFTGHRSDIREIFTVSNLVLSLSSKPESFGRTVLEALSLGTPVAGYAHGGVGEVLSAIFPEGRVPMGDIDMLTAKVQDLLTRKTIVAKNNAFPLKRMLDETIAVYESLCG